MSRHPEHATTTTEAFDAGLVELRLIQFPFSHNCLKVRLALAHKGLTHQLEDIRPMDRTGVIDVSGQEFVPVLVHGGQAIADSTAILRHLERTSPSPSLVPTDPVLRAECWLLEDWADQAFMALSRRIAYRAAFAMPGVLGPLFFPSSPEEEQCASEGRIEQTLRERFAITDQESASDLADARAAAALAVRRLSDGPYLFGEALTVADIALASMSHPLSRSPELAEDPDVHSLLAWAEPIITMEQSTKETANIRRNDRWTRFWEAFFPRLA